MIFGDDIITALVAIQMGGGGGVEASIIPLTVTENGTYTAADYGCDGFDPVNVQVPDRYDEGYTQGYTDGYNEGYDNGHTDGYDNGYNEGTNAAFVYGGIESGGAVNGKDSNVSVVYTEYPFKGNGEGYIYTTMDGREIAFACGAVWEFYVDGVLYDKEPLIYTYNETQFEVFNWYIRNYPGAKEGALYVSHKNSSGTFMNHYEGSWDILYNFVPTK